MKRKIVLMIEMVILFFISLGSFDYSLEWFWDFKLKNGFIFFISVLFALLVAKEIIKIKSKDEKALADVLTFAIIGFVFFLIVNKDYDGTVSKNLLNNISFPIIGITTSIVGFYSIVKNCKTTKE